MENLKPVFEILSTGGPAALSALMFVFWWLERKERQELQKQIFELATKQIESNSKLESSLIALKELINQLSHRL